MSPNVFTVQYINIWANFKMDVAKLTSINTTKDLMRYDLVFQSVSEPIVQTDLYCMHFHRAKRKSSVMVFPKKFVCI